MNSLPPSLQVKWRDSEDQSAYESARVNKVFNLDRPQRFPRGIVQATCIEDVVGAVKLATLSDMKIAVRSGGHSTFVWSLQNDSILVDLSAWNDVCVDSSAGVAVVTAGVTGEQLTRCLTQHKMMFPTGHHPGVSMGGFILQGGQGWNCRNWGWACEHVVALEVVTSRGEVLQCNKDVNSDLFWAAKGSGPLFPCILTKVHLQLRPEPRILSSYYVYPASRCFEVFRWVQSILWDADKDTEIVMVGFRSGTESFVKVHFVTMKTNSEWATAALNVLHMSRPCQAIAEEQAREESIETLYHSQALANPEGHFYHTNCAYLDNAAEISQVLASGFMTLPSEKSFVFWYPMYPRSRELNTPDLAVQTPSDHYFAIYCVGRNEHEHLQNQDWTRAIMEGLESKIVGKYIGDCDMTGPTTWYWTEEAFERLQAIRRAWDPSTLFCSV